MLYCLKEVHHINPENKDAWSTSHPTKLMSLWFLIVSDETSSALERTATSFFKTDHLFSVDWAFISLIPYCRVRHVLRSNIRTSAFSPRASSITLTKLCFIKVRHCCVTKPVHPYSLLEKRIHTQQQMFGKNLFLVSVRTWQKCSQIAYATLQNIKAS